MLTLKIMSGQDMPDNDAAKDFTLIQVNENEVLGFQRVEDSEPYMKEEFKDFKVVALIKRPDGSEQAFPLTGNAYVMNANGKTISSRASY